MNSKIYNLIAMLLIWVLAIIFHYLFWEQIINFIYDYKFTYIYILLFPILLSFLSYKLAIIKSIEERKNIIVFGIIAPLLIYYTIICIYTLIASRAISNFKGF